MSRIAIYKRVTSRQLHHKSSRYKWVASQYINESRLGSCITTRRASTTCVINESCLVIWRRHVSLYKWVASRYWNESNLGSYITTRRASTTRCTEPTTCARTALSTRPLPRYALSHVPPVNESCPFCEWVMSLLWISHVTSVKEACPSCEWVMSLVWRCAHNNMCVSSAWHFRLVLCQGTRWVLSLLWMSHVPSVNESCPSCQWIMSVLRKRHVPPVNETRDSCEEDVCMALLFLSRYALSHVPPVNESCPSCEWVMSLMWMSHVPHTNEPYLNQWFIAHISRCGMHWVTSLLSMGHVPHANEPYLDQWFIAHIWRCVHGSFDSCFAKVCIESRPSCAWVMSLTWMSHVTRLKMRIWHFCLPRCALSHVPPVNESHSSFEWFMSRSLSHVPHVDKSCHTYEGGRKALLFAKGCIESCPSWKWVMSLMWMSHVPHVSESCPFCEWVMSLMRMSHVSINESWMSHFTRMKVHTRRFSLPRCALSHVPPVNESCPSCEWVMSRSTSHGTHMKVRT